MSSSNRIHTDTAHFLSPREEHSLATPATLAGSLGRRQDLNFFPFRQHYQQHQAEEEERARARRVPVVIRVSLTARMSLHVNVLGGFEIDDELRERARAEPELPRALAMGFLAHMQRTIERGLAGQNVHIRAREPRPMFERIGEGDGLMLGGEWAVSYCLPFLLLGPFLLSLGGTVCLQRISGAVLRAAGRVERKLTETFPRPKTASTRRARQPTSRKF